MSTNTKYTFCGKNFTSQDIIKNAIRAILYANADSGEQARRYRVPTTMLSGAPEKFIREVFTYFRPETLAEKTGGKEYGFAITAPPVHPGYITTPPKKTQRPEKWDDSVAVWLDNPCEVGMAIRAVQIVLEGGELVPISFNHLRDDIRYEWDLKQTLRHLVKPKTDDYRMAVFEAQDTIY